MLVLSLGEHAVDAGGHALDDGLRRLLASLVLVLLLERAERLQLDRGRSRNMVAPIVGFRFGDGG